MQKCGSDPLMLSVKMTIRLFMITETFISSTDSHYSPMMMMFHNRALVTPSSFEFTEWRTHIFLKFISSVLSSPKLCKLRFGFSRERELVTFSGHLKIFSLISFHRIARKNYSRLYIFLSLLGYHKS
jgi:hypothetical protein